MARFDDKNGGRISGLIGNIVIADDVVRMRPKTRDKKNWTEEQKAQRTRFSAVIELYRNMKDVLVKPIWSHATTKKVNAYNLFLKENLHAFDTAGNIQDPLKLKMSVGSLPLPFNIKASIDPSDPIKINISWKIDTKEAYDRRKDHLVAVFFDGEHFTRPISTEFLREEEFASIDFPEGFGSGSYMYVFFGNREKDAYSESWAVGV